MPRPAAVSVPLPAMPPPLKPWADSVSKAEANPQWQDYDRDIQDIVDAYNSHLAKTPGYVPLDWQMVKAMLFVETGAGHPGDWSSRPMQIGNTYDPGLQTLLLSGDKLALIVPDRLRVNLTSASATTDGRMNIVAGVGYLLLRAARWGRGTKITGARVLHIIVGKHDSLWHIARSVGTTEPLLLKMNPSIKAYNLKPGTILNYQKAQDGDVILGWAELDSGNIARLYNGKDVQDYTLKLDYAYALIRYRRLPSWLSKNTKAGR